eukprot:COSAG02_NODE_18223_length_952_cov_1.977726_1_plen_123_part_10
MVLLRLTASRRAAASVVSCVRAALVPLRLPRRAHASQAAAAAAVGTPAFKVSRAAYKASFDAATYTPGAYDFWLDVAREEIDWFTAPTVALQGRMPGVQVENRWFPDGTTNLCLNALDRQNGW